MTATAGPLPELDLANRLQLPDFDAVAAEARALAQRCDAAADGAAVVRELLAWNQLRLALDQGRELASVRYHKDTRDAAARADEDAWNDRSSLLRELDVLHARTLLAAAARFPGALERRFGAHLLALREVAAATFAPAIAGAITEEARLVTRYQALLALDDIEFEGQRMGVSGIARYFTDGDRARRLAAQRAHEAFLARHADELDGIYAELVRLRDGMGRGLGHASFTPLGYQLLRRTEYGPAEVAAFRDEVRRELVPLADALQRARARRLGLPKMLYHDERISDPAGNPRPLGGVDFCVAQAQRMYDELHPDMGRFFTLMRARGLLDLEQRPGKSAGGFCTHFAALGLPFVFASFNGSDHDVHVLTHECGHAFNMYLAAAEELLEYRQAGYEACEVHSMSMEYLTYPWMELFFGAAEADRFRRVHLEQKIVALPYMALGDHFQHEVYAHPGMSAGERRALWRRLESEYQPWRDYGGELPHLAEGTLWHRQLHFYTSPFYYIDYALAETCALGFWRRAEHDRATALADYVRICRPGGSIPFSAMVEMARLPSPFQPGCLAEVAVHVRKVLDL